ncbi:aminotransferase class V-fold PLP-dependent enzyme [Texcoconibacillus texcoconensis]|uniref:cysteine desulfurase n=1 Tax=Texcoconibacillus texcoconensis TaxID=1095777 RepID=A0A840QTC2_9BACI|nr:aminotransferase class V-fold PLP-dependent enzyme [Texcoconibacillus texcoconensis]MBB5174772.1 cysteine desulfurase family protein [Texcoconibacillus texcoconensis]
MIYFDQAASSFPKPKGVTEAMVEAVESFAANPGRGGHQLAQRAHQVVSHTRKQLASFFSFKHPERVLFYPNATYAINQAVKGLPFQEGDHVVSTAMEHNSVRRPLEELKDSHGIEVTYIHPDYNGNVSEEKLEESFLPNTKLFIATHASNVTGALLPIERLCEYAKQRGILTCVDASQTAGIRPIDMSEQNIDLLAFPGHKGLLGPQGTGVLMAQQGIQLTPLIQGGTGSQSESRLQPSNWPESMESGTLNTPGIAGLSKAIEQLEKIGLEEVANHEKKLVDRCLQGLQAIEHVRYVGPDQSNDRIGVISFEIEGVNVHEVAMILDEHYQIAVRAGLHCSPAAHEWLETIDTGLIRVSVGPYNTEEEVDDLIKAIDEICQGLLGV